MGREAELLERRRQREPDDEEGHDVCGGEKGQGATCDQVIQRLEALPGTNDDLEGTYEAFGIVRSVESGDGVEAWVKLHQKYSQRTMSRMMRVLMECMYPKEVKGSELVQAILQWEMKWNQMMKDQPGGTNIPELWRMAALMKMCPKEIKHNIELSWDTIDEKYSVMRERATNAAEKEGGAVLMDVGIVEGGGCEEDEGEECHEYEWVDAVYPTTRCYFCQVYGHMARECPAKSKR